MKVGCLAAEWREGGERDKGRRAADQCIPARLLVSLGIALPHA